MCSREKIHLLKVYTLCFIIFYAFNDWEMNVISVGYTSNERRTLLNAAHD